MIQTKHLVIYWYSKGHKADAINDKLKTTSAQQHRHIQQLLTGAEN
jgi:hypothetical protein